MSFGKIFSILWAGVGVLLVGGAPLQATEIGSSEVVQMNIEPGVVLARSTEHFVGFGFETSALARAGYFSPTNRHLVKLFRTLGSHGLIRIGGNISDFAKFVPDGTPVAAAEPHTTVFNQAELYDLGAFARKTGWDVMWGFNLKTGTVADAVVEAVAVQKALGSHLQSFEIGNETDIQPQLKKDSSAYLAAYREFKSAIRVVLPHAKFSGPDSAGNVRWVESFAPEESHDLLLLTDHYYRCGAKNSEATLENLLLPHRRWEEDLQRLQTLSSKTGVPFRINEINSFSGGGKKGVSDTFASALWALDTMFLMASHGAEGINLETDVNQLGFVSHYSPIFRESSGELVARPEYYGMLAFSKAGVGGILQTSGSATGVNMKVYAVKTKKHELWVTVINKDLFKPATIEISLPPTYSKADCIRLAAPSVESRDHVTLANSEVSSDGAWKLGRTEMLLMTGGAVSVTVPATSAALVRLR